MKTTKQDLEMFTNLGSSEIGKWLVDYAKRLQDYAHDSRSWEGEEDKNSASLTSRLLEKQIVEKIRPKHESEPIVSEFE